MIKRYPPINPSVPHILHGGDYNPDQWRDTPEIWDEDMRLMQLANCNTMSIGIFSWSALEPEEGCFDFGWMDEIMDKLADNGGYAVLATPSGARPAWMSHKYKEVLRVNADRKRILHSKRHNHCYSSPIYREKVRLINTKLAERYKNHPALLVWHISNEYGGECHCELCQKAFREWLKIKYDNSLDKLNRQWWNGFWSHTYTSWEQIESPAPHGETLVHALTLDWKRFVTHQTIDFMKNEIAPLKEITPNIPITTNFMGLYTGLDYWKFKSVVDVVSWDSYPTWHGELSDSELAVHVGFAHDINRCIKGGKPFMLMESTPSNVNWAQVNKLKRPGMHLLSSIQAVAHGADTVQYFQWRKSRGSSEKFHGAVIDHCGHENTRVFRDVAQLGDVLKKLDGVVGTTVRPETAIIYDWENRWAIDDLAGLCKDKKDYDLACKSHYGAFWRQGIPIDVIDMEQDFSCYKLLVAPMLYMIKPGVAERIDAFVKNGGTLVATYLSGMVNENDLCFLGGFPGPLRNVLGIWSEEIDSLYESDTNHAVIKDGSMKLQEEYGIKTYCEHFHAETANVLAVYKNDFYKGSPALTVNSYGKGKAYYIAFRDTGEFVNDFYGYIAKERRLEKALDVQLPQGVTAQMRTDGENKYIFIQNYNNHPITINLNGIVLSDALTGTTVFGSIDLNEYGISILKQPN